MVLDRLKEFIDLKGITIAAFERSIGMSNASFGKSLKQGKSIGSDKLEKILSVYPDLNPIWLLTGRGEIFNTKITENLIKSNDKDFDKEFDKKRKLQNSLSMASDVTASSNGRTYQGTQEKEPLTPTGIPLSQVKAKIYATHSDEEIKETIATMTERQIIEMYEDGRIYPRKAVEQLMSALQDANLKLQSEITELKAEIRRLQLNNTPQKETQVETKK